MLGDRAEVAFRQSMIAGQGSLGIFFNNGIAATLTIGALLLGIWPAVMWLWRQRGARPARARVE